MSELPLRTIVTALAAEVRARSRAAAQWGVEEGTLAEVLERSVRARLGDDPGTAAVRAYVEGLHLDELVLACACGAGHEGAWEHLIREYRPGLHAAARAIAGEDARELAESLWAELFGFPDAAGRRRSLLAWYHGRSRLLTWMRSLLAQRHIDRHRASRRLVPLAYGEGPDAPAIEPPAPPAAPPGRDRRVEAAQQALDAAMAALPDADRLRLRLYYGEDLSLAEIGRLLNEHEATVSRKLARARQHLKTGVETALRTQGLSAAAIAECLAEAADAPELQLTRLLSRAEDG